VSPLPADALARRGAIMEVVVVPPGLVAVAVLAATFAAAWATARDVAAARADHEARLTGVGAAPAAAARVRDDVRRRLVEVERRVGDHLHDEHDEGRPR
jgi:hypothetical protein